MNKMSPEVSEIMSVIEPLEKKLFGYVSEAALSTTSPERATGFLQEDIAEYLRRADDMDEAVKEIDEMIDASPIAGKIRQMVSIGEAWKDAEVRRDWAAALQSANPGRAIAPKIGWGFRKEDVLILTDLYKAGRFQEKILDLLEDCNFHMAAGLLMDGRYEEIRSMYSECAAQS